MVNEKRILDLFFDLVKIDSESFEEKGVSDFLENYFSRKGLEVYRDKAGEMSGGNGSNIIVHIKGDIEGEGIVLNAHQDTVKPGKGIKPYIKDGFVYSEGDTILGGDDKAGIAAIIETYEVLKENNIPHRDLTLFFTITEEAGMKGAKNLDLTKLPCKEIVFVDSPAAPGKISLAGPAKNGIVAKFTGRKAHAGIEPEKGVSACSMMAKAIAGFSFGRIDEETTANVGTVSGGDVTNVVAEFAEFTAEIRSRNGDKLRAQTALLKASCEEAAKEFGGEVEFIVSNDYPELKLNKDSFIHTQMLKAYEAEGITPEYVMSGGGGDANILAGEGYNTIGLGCGMYDVHATTEKLCIAELLQSVRIMLTLAQ